MQEFRKKGAGPSSSLTKQGICEKNQQRAEKEKEQRLQISEAR